MATQRLKMVTDEAWSSVPLFKVQYERSKTLALSGSRSRSQGLITSNRPHCKDSWLLVLQDRLLVTERGYSAFHLLF